MELKNTINFMNSKDYKERFIAEYWQTKIRYEKLKTFNAKIEAAQRVRFSDIVEKIPEPKHDCPTELLEEQQRAMGQYLHILEVRAVIENIDLNKINSKEVSLNG